MMHRLCGIAYRIRYLKVRYTFSLKTDHKLNFQSPSNARNIIVCPTDTDSQKVRIIMLISTKLGTVS